MTRRCGAKRSNSIRSELSKGNTLVYPAASRDRFLDGSFNLAGFEAILVLLSNGEVLGEAICRAELDRLRLTLE